MYNLKSYLNLTPFDEMDADRHRELSRRGGLASAEIRRHRKKQREALDAIERYGGAMKTFLELSEMSAKEIAALLKSR